MEKDEQTMNTVLCHTEITTVKDSSMKTKPYFLRLCTMYDVLHSRKACHEGLKNIAYTGQVCESDPIVHERWGRFEIG